MTETLHITVRGRVQGVGFRAFTVAAANRHRIVGWVMNSPDGRSVEIVAQGDSEAMRAFLDLVGQGTAASRVDHVEDHPLESGETFAQFSVRH